MHEVMHVGVASQVEIWYKYEIGRALSFMLTSTGADVLIYRI